MAFTHLHVHSEYSLLDGSSRIKELISRAKELGLDSIAITDHGAMFGVIEFYKEAIKEGIKPILGCEIYVTADINEKTNKDESRYYHLILLAENNKGFQNLTKIVSLGYTKGFYYKPRVDYDILRTYHEGLIAGSACLAGEVARELAIGNFESAKDAALKYEGIFGNGNFFLELQDHGISTQRIVNTGLLRIHEETGIELIATNDSHYTYKDDAQSHDILLCIQTGKKVSDEDRMRYEGGQYYLKSEDEMRELFKYAPEAIDNTHKIANRCNVSIEFGKYKLPKFALPEGVSAKDYLRELCEKGIEERYPHALKAADGGESLYKINIKNRLDYELSTIENMGFVDYFLIVWDFIRYAKSKDIPVGPGRGSAAGSIVAYSLKITNIDPIKYNLLFERFLNPERVSMPDIDVDFCYERRSEVIDYVVAKYGAENVAQIVTFGTLAARGVIRDVGRVLDLPYGEVDKIAKMIPAELNMTLDRALKESPDFRNAYESDDRIKYLVDMSKKLEGLPRHTSMHAAGVLITDTNVDKYVPLSRNSDGNIVTQYTMTTLEELGLLKMDFLGLRTLTVIKNCIDQVAINQHINIDIDNIDMDDKNVYAMIASGDTAGVFQLESAGMTSFMKQLKPESIEDIIAGVALYRPGPMDFIPRYIKGKENKENVIYECDKLKPILEPTYGCIVYQEQVMQIVQSLAGYTLGRADLVRRAMSKKKHDVMAKERESFVYGNEKEGVKGCINNGIDEKTANHIYDEMTDFASYAFNKSHAAAYAVVAYETAYLKYYYAPEFFASLLTSVMDSTVKLTEYIEKVKSMGIKLMLPDVNSGEYGFAAKVIKGETVIIYGLSAIKGVGKNVVCDIVKERELHGKFTDLEDFMVRMPGSANKKTIEGFIKAGALDLLPGTRKQKLNLMYDIFDKINAEKKADFNGQVSLFDIAGEEGKEDYKLTLPDVGEFSKEELLEFEKEATGLYLSGHPMEEYLDDIKKLVTLWSKDYTATENEKLRLKDGERAVSAGIITEVKKKITKNGSQMAFISLEDIYGKIEAIAFPKVLDKYRDMLYEGNKVYLSGHISIDRDEKGTLAIEKVSEIGREQRELWLAFNNMTAYNEMKKKVEDILFEHTGLSTVVIYLREEKAMRKLSRDMAVNIDEELKSSLTTLIGSENIKTKIIAI